MLGQAFFAYKRICFMSTFEQKAQDYHKAGCPGKIAISVTKRVASQDYLSLAYSPGVAVPCVEIQRDSAMSNSDFRD